MRVRHARGVAVRERVLRAVGRERGQHGARQGPLGGADFQYAQRAPVRQIPDGFFHGAGDPFVTCGDAHALPAEPGHRLRDVVRIGFPDQQFHEAGGDGAQRFDLDSKLWKAVGEFRQSHAGIRRLGKVKHLPRVVAGRLQDPVIRQGVEQFVNDAVACICDPELPGDIGRRKNGVEFRLPAQLQECVQGAGAGRFLQSGQEVPREGLQRVLPGDLRCGRGDRGSDARRRGELCGSEGTAAAQPGRLPPELIESGIHASGGLIPAFDLLGAEAENIGHAPPLLVVHEDVRNRPAFFLHEHRRVGPEMRGRLSDVETDAVNRGGKLEELVRPRILAGRVTRLDGMKARVQHRRMEKIRSGFRNDGFGDHDFGQRFLRLAPDVLHLPEQGAELVALREVSLVVVIVIRLLRQLLLKRRDIRGFRLRRGEFHEAAARVHVPRLAVSGRAGHEEGPVVLVVHDAHGRRFAAGDEERLGSLDVLHRPCFAGVQLARDREPDFDVRGGREDDAVPEAVILQIFKHFRFSHELPCGHGRANPEPQQGVCRGGQALVQHLGRFDPEVLAGPWIRRQRNHAASASIEPGPVEFQPVNMQAGRLGQQLHGFIFAPAQRVENGALPGLCGKAVYNRLTQDGVGSDFKVEGLACSGQTVNGRREPHRFADVPPPVTGIQCLARLDLARYGGHPRNARGLRLDVGKTREQLLADGVHLVRVEGVVNTQPANERARGLQPFHDGLQRFGVAGKRDHGGAVDGGDVHLLTAVADRVQRGGLREADRGHASESRGPLLQAAAVVDDLHGVIEAVDAGAIGGRHFPDAVSDDL